MRIFEINNLEHMLLMDPWTFDQTAQGWRSLPLHKQSEILKLYIDKHIKNGEFINSNSDKVDPSILIWHLGQILAFQSRYQQAINWMTLSKNKDSDWNDYVDATIAFIKKDKKAFDKINIRINNNSDTLIRLKNNWNKEYKDAY